ncbi:hypothetical protein [Kosakonia sp. S42]|uniref:hypothetical protein n=1 Tax=Kosakonia sp. S42 TaxID=2767458 RepID=UPI00190CDAD8|nr:hypothetical protein [Kosakonia sp. S42]MBK0018904.1 hypothetical protein [Kosakonia sp. S42]
MVYFIDRRQNLFGRSQTGKDCDGSGRRIPDRHHNQSWRIRERLRERIIFSRIGAWSTAFSSSTPTA